MDSKKSDRFAAIVTYSQIQQMCQDAIPMNTKQTTLWSTKYVGGVIRMEQE